MWGLETPGATDAEREVPNCQSPFQGLLAGVRERNRYRDAWVCERERKREERLHNLLVRLSIIHTC